MPAREEIAKRREVLAQIARREREVGPATTALGDGRPAVFPTCSGEIVECDELEVAAILEADERVVCEPAGMLTARRHREAALPVIGDGRGEVEHDEDDMVETADHESSIRSG